MAVKPPWSRLIRFVGADDEVYFGDALTDQLDFDVGAAATEDPISLHAKVVLGDPLSGRCKVTNRVEAVKRLLGPFTMTTMPAIRCIGGNYREHCTSVFVSDARMNSEGLSHQYTNSTLHRLGIR